MKRAGAIAIAIALVVALVALGLWQLERRVWKHRLVAQVERSLATPPLPAPAPPAWNTIDDRAAYRRVVLEGRYLAGRDTAVRASSRLGYGYWLVTPFAERRGFVVLVNRGFVPPEHRDARPPAGYQRLTGLLRLSEPGGALLRANDPPRDAWYSRDVAAIAVARGTGKPAPYFVDADADPASPWPRGGMTTIRFADNHLVYALTWFALAALVVLLLARALRRRA